MSNLNDESFFLSQRLNCLNYITLIRRVLHVACDYTVQETFGDFCFSCLDKENSKK